MMLYHGMTNNIVVTTFVAGVSQAVTDNFPVSTDTVTLAVMLVMARRCEIAVVEILVD